MNKKILITTVLITFACTCLFFVQKKTIDLFVDDKFYEIVIEDNFESTQTKILSHLKEAWQTLPKGEQTVFALSKEKVDFVHFAKTFEHKRFNPIILIMRKGKTERDGCILLSSTWKEAEEIMYSKNDWKAMERFLLEHYIKPSYIERLLNKS